MQDRSGDSAIIEYVKGKLVVHQGPEFRVMTNDPDYDTAPSLFWLDLKKANLRPRSPLLFLDPHDPTVGGDARFHLKRWRAGLL